MKPPYTPAKIKKLIPKDFLMPSKKDIADVVRAATYLTTGTNYKKPYVEFVGNVVVLSVHSYNELMAGLEAAKKSYRGQVEGLIAATTKKTRK